MKKYITAMLTIGLLVFASVAQAGSHSVSMGTYGGSGWVEVDIMESNVTSSVTLYRNGTPVFTCDMGGVTYAASGVAWSRDGGIFVIYYLPEGDYDFEVTVQPNGSFSTNNGNPFTSIGWVGSNNDWVYNSCVMM